MNFKLKAFLIMQAVNLKMSSTPYMLTQTKLYLLSEEIKLDKDIMFLLLNN